jgi:acetolactate synthase-1/2/3 large subunit
VVLALPEDMLTTPTAAPVLPRVRAGAAWPAPGGLRDLRTPAAGRRAALRHRRRQRLGRRSLPRAAALCRELAAAGGLRLPLPGHLRQPAPLYAGDVGIGINPKLAQRIATPTWCSPSACAWAR